MNKATLEKLKKNPHYKMSQKQQEEGREEMVEFGKIPLHDNTMRKHPTGPRRLARENKNVLE